MATTERSGGDLDLGELVTAEGLSGVDVTGVSAAWVPITASLEIASPPTVMSVQSAPRLPFALLKLSEAVAANARWGIASRSTEATRAPRTKARKESGRIVWSLEVCIVRGSSLYRLRLVRSAGGNSCDPRARARRGVDGPTATALNESPPPRRPTAGFVSDPGASHAARTCLGAGSAGADTSDKVRNSVALMLNSQSHGPTDGPTPGEIRGSGRSRQRSRVAPWVAPLSLLRHMPALPPLEGL